MSANQRIRYDSPAVFGPSLMPDRSPCDDAETSVISFETTRDAAAKLLPRFYELDDRPIVSVYRITYRGVDYLAGGEYREAVISVDAVYNGPNETIKAAFCPVLWVDQVWALISGRELLGSPKVLGKFPVEETGPGTRAFEVYESDGREVNTRLFRGEWSDLKPLSGDALAQLNDRVKEVRTLGWKVIPSLDGPPDADYPTQLLMRWNFNQASIGNGRIIFDTPSAKQAPVSSRIMKVLADLPIKEYRKGLVAKGSAVVERMSTRRLPLPVVNRTV